MAEINPFNDVPTIQEPNSTQQIAGQSFVSAPAGLAVGAGGQIVRLDPYSGLWIGGRTAATAPFAVDLNGVMKATGAILSDYASQIDLSNLEGSALLKDSTTQILGGVIKVGGNNIIIDGANKRIIINDGTYDRILIGYQSGGF